MSKTIFFLTIFLTIVAGISSYLATNNVYIALVILIVFLLYSIVANKTIINKFELKSRKLQECHDFINKYIISYSATKSLIVAFESASIEIKGELKEEINHIEKLSSEEKIKYLSNYFDIEIYKMFIYLINTQIEEGGDILKMSELLRGELLRMESDREIFNNKSLSKFVEFVILWFLTFLILVFVRVALNEYFIRISSSVLYVSSVSFLYLFLLVSLHYFLKKMTNEKISFRGIKK